jgi:small subunit ribosomal protein S4
MGKPRFSRKKYETPSHPWQEARIKAENELMKKYGLKNKREIWKAQTALRKFRGQARVLLAKIRSADPQVKKEVDQLLTHLTRMNILPLNSNLDDVLALNVEAFLSRRLQTLTYLKGLAHTPHQARQLIAHGHIAIGGRKTTVPSYMVTKNEESGISYIPGSPLNDVMHPARPRSDFTSPPLHKEEGVTPPSPTPAKPPVEKQPPMGKKPSEDQPKPSEQPKKEDKKQVPPAAEKKHVEQKPPVKEETKKEAPEKPPSKEQHEAPKEHKENKEGKQPKKESSSEKKEPASEKGGA